jgi:hypothetical protein
MADWDRTDVFSLASPMHPPPFMWKGAGDTYDVEKEKGVIREHYDKAVGVLNEGAGYDTLRGMMDRLEAHHNRAKEAASGYESRRNYARLQSAVMRESVISIARERVEREDDEAVEEEANQILDEPMGAHAETLIGDGIDSVWRTPWSSFGDKESTLKDINIHFNPENNSNYKVQFEEDDLHRTDQRVFDGDETWRGALESIHQRWEHLEEQHERAVNTKELLRFRLGVIETVLYRFEAYGSVEKMSDTEAQRVVDRELPDIFSGRPTLRNHAERLVKKYRQRSTSLPDGMEAFKEWVPDGEDATGRSIVASFQGVYRKEEGVSDRYDDPESFCDLVERLLEKHFDERRRTF